MTAYIIQFIMFQLLFLLVYETLLKKETFFTWNRIYLLVTAVVSLLLPLVKIEALSLFAPPESFSAITTEWLPEIFIGNTPHTIEHLPAVEISAKSSGINWWLMVYLLGFLGSILLVFKKYKNLERLFRFKTISAEKEWRIIEIPNSTIACSFYKTIFLGDQLTEAEKGQILSHELVHVKQKHSLDLVFFEILKIIFWFNPLIYIYQNRIATLHEFIADAAVVNNTGRRNYYEQLLNSAFNTKNISFINQFFNSSLIKKRICMLQKSKSRTFSKLKYLIFIPLVLVMLNYVAYSQYLVAQEKKSPDLKDFKVVVEKTENGIKMQSIKGSAWIALSFNLNDDRPQAIDEYGMTELDKVSSNKDSNLADFLFTITINKNGIILKGIEGTAWTDLRFSLSKNEKQGVNQYGMTKLD